MGVRGCVEGRHLIANKCLRPGRKLDYWPHGECPRFPVPEELHNARLLYHLRQYHVRIEDRDRM